MVQINRKNGLMIVVPLAFVGSTSMLVAANEHQHTWSEDLREHHPEIYKTSDNTPIWQPMESIGGGRRLRASSPTKHQVDRVSEDDRLGNFGRWLKESVVGSTANNKNDNIVDKVSPKNLFDKGTAPNNVIGDKSKKTAMRGNNDEIFFHDNIDVPNLRNNGRNLYEDYVPEGGYDGGSPVNGDIPNFRNSDMIRDQVKNDISISSVPIERYKATHARPGTTNEPIRQVEDNQNNRRQLRSSGRNSNNDNNFNALRKEQLSSGTDRLSTTETLDVELKEYPVQQAVQGDIPNLRSSSALREEVKENFNEIQKNGGNVMEEMSIPVERLPKNMRGYGSISSAVQKNNGNFGLTNVASMITDNDKNNLIANNDITSDNVDIKKKVNKFVEDGPIRIGGGLRRR